MSQIYSSSAPLIAFFETGDVPTADNFESLIKSFAIYDGTLPIISGSSTSTGSFGQLDVGNSVGSALIPNYTNTLDLGTAALEWKDLHISGTIFTVTASIDTVSSSLVPTLNETFDLGSETLKYQKAHLATGSIDIISSSLIPAADDTFDLGSSALQWKDLYLDGVAYIDNIGETVTVATSSLKRISSSLIPTTDDAFDLGASGMEWKDLYVDGTAYIDTLSISALAKDIDIHSISASGQLLNISGTVHPAADNTYDLGTSGLQWKDLYVNGVAYIDTIGSSTEAPGVDAYISTATISTIAASGSFTSNITVSGSLVPGNDDSVDLGSSALQWNDLYIDGVANIDTLGAVADAVTNAYISSASVQYLSASSPITIGAALIPDQDNIQDLGSSTLEYKDLYVDGIAYIDQLSGSGAAGDAAITSSVNIVPGADGTYDLGSSDLEWKDLYIDGTANIDTLSADSASIGRVATSLIPTANNSKDLGSSTFGYATAHIVTASISGFVSSSLIPHLDDTYDLGSSGNEWKDLYIDGTANIDTLVADNITNSALSTSLSGSTYSAIFTTSASVASIRFKNLPTDVSQARLIGTGSLYLSGSEQNDSKALFVFTG